MKYKIGDNIVIKENKWAQEGVVEIIEVDEKDSDKTYRVKGISKTTGLRGRYWMDNCCIAGLAELTIQETIQETNNKEMVNHPKHYQGNGLEAIEVIEAFNLNFNLGNAVKYILRCGKKDNDLQELNKAIWYLERELKNRK